MHTSDNYNNSLMRSDKPLRSSESTYTGFPSHGRTCLTSAVTCSQVNRLFVWAQAYYCDLHQVTFVNTVCECLIEFTHETVDRLDISLRPKLI